MNKMIELAAVTVSPGELALFFQQGLRYHYTEKDLYNGEIFSTATHHARPSPQVPDVFEKPMPMPDGSTVMVKEKLARYGISCLVDFYPKPGGRGKEHLPRNAYELGMNHVGAVKASIDEHLSSCCCFPDSTAKMCCLDAYAHFESFNGGLLRATVHISFWALPEPVGESFAASFERTSTVDVGA